MATIYYVDLKRPWRQVTIVEADIVQCEKLAWAVDCRGAKRLLGASAFQTLASAERARVGLLTRLVKVGPLIKCPKVYEAARTALQQMGHPVNAVRRF